jgi:hypothetical protein
MGCPVIYVIYVCKQDIPIHNRTCHSSTWFMFAYRTSHPSTWFMFANRSSHPSTWFILINRTWMGFPVYKHKSCRCPVYKHKSHRWMGCPVYKYKSRRWMECPVYKHKSRTQKLLNQAFLLVNDDLVTITEYLCHIWKRICSICRKHIPIHFSFMTYYCNYRNTIMSLVEQELQKKKDK